MVPRTFLFIFYAGSGRLGSNNFWNSSYKEKTTSSTHVSIFPFLMTMTQLRHHTFSLSCLKTEKKIETVKK